MSALQPSDSVTRIYTFFSVFSSIAIYHRVLNIVPAVLYNRNLWFIHSVLNSLHLLILTSQRSPPLPSCSHKSVTGSSASYFRFHVKVRSYGVCLSLTDLAGASLGPSMLLHVALFCSLSWLSNISLYIHAPCLYAFLCPWTLRLSPCLDCCEYRSACLF